MENTCYDPGNASMGVTYTILVDGDRRYVYGIQCGDMLVYADCSYVLGYLSEEDFSGAVPSEVYRGFGRIADATYKERIY